MTKEKEYFSYQNLAELVNLDEHITFAESMMNAYEWSDDVQAELLEKLQQIKAKQADKLLNISIIGEFSTGKSTFINALMRSEILSTSSLQGTTAACTIMEYSENYSISLEYKNGQKKNFQFGSLEELRAKLEFYTTDYEEAQKIETVRVYLPSEQLKNGFRIIDTPGTNATVAWHEDVTRKTLQEVSDISLILTSADKQLPDTFCHFIEENIKDILPQCVFIVTKIDTIRAKEQKRVVDYVKLKVRQRFEIEEPIVFAYSSQKVLEHCTEGEKSDSNVLKESYENEKKIFSYTAKYRMIALTKKLIGMTDNMYNSISSHMVAMKQERENELEILQNSKQANLNEFVETQKDMCVGYFIDVVNEKLDDLKEALQEEINTCCLAIDMAIDEKTSASSVLEFIKEDLSSFCNYMSGEMVSETTSNIYDEIYDEYEEQILEFQNDFEEYFKNMDLLEITFEKNEQPRPSAPDVSFADFADVAHYVANEIEKDNVALGGGAAAGAAIGTMLLPGIGTLLGAAAGAFGGLAAFGGASIDEIISTAKEKLSDPVFDYFVNSAQQIMDSVIDYAQTLSDQLGMEMDNYLWEYKEEVDRRIAKEELAETELQSKISAIQSDLQSIKDRKDKINSIQNHLGELSPA